MKKKVFLLLYDSNLKIEKKQLESNANIIEGIPVSRCDQLPSDDEELKLSQSAILPSYKRFICHISVILLSLGWQNTIFCRKTSRE